MKVKRVLWWSAAAVPPALLAAGLIAYATSTNICPTGSAGGPNSMKAIVYCDYGEPEVLNLRDVEKPAPGDDEVLVRVRAASVNPLDWHFIRGTPYVMRMMSGMRKPKEVRVGVDFAGTVEAVGRNVARFHPGDEVYGGETGAFAEYVAVRQAGAIAPKPAALSFEQAASLPIAALTALQGLRDGGRVQAGQKVLINGASGGVGTFAVQIAKAFGAEVTGVCSTRNLEMVRTLGADHVIDYTREDFTKSGQRYDMLLDNVGNRSLSECRRVLTPRGRCVLIGGGGPKDGMWVGPLPRMLGARVVSRFVSQDLGMFMARLSQKDLAALGDLVQSGKLKPVIDRRYKLNDLPEAVRYLEKGHARGKVVIAME